MSEREGKESHGHVSTSRQAEEEEEREGGGTRIAVKGFPFHNWKCPDLL